MKTVEIRIEMKTRTMRVLLIGEDQDRLLSATHLPSTFSIDDDFDKLTIPIGILRKCNNCQFSFRKIY